MTDPYASHLPVLHAIGRHLPIRRVLEFGAGMYSTPTFLDTDEFPALERLDSVEAFEEWRDTMRAALRGETRLVWYEDDDGMDYDAPDLIFIDNGQTDVERIPVIERISALRPAAIVVIHDYEHLPYQSAATFDHTRIYTRTPPWTAVCWNGDRPDLEEFCDVHLA